MKNKITILSNLILCCSLILGSCKESSNNQNVIKTQGLYNPDDFPKIELSIDDDKLSTLDSIRSSSLLLNDFSHAKKWFKANIILEEGITKAKIRLKGDQKDHYNTDRFSMRLKYKDNNTSKVISLQHPKTRQYISEWIFHQLLKQENINYLNYNFVTVVINNKIKGLYAAEEHLTNYGIEQKWNKPPGPILKFDDSGFWAGGLNTVNRDVQFDTEAYLNAEIRIYNEHERLSELAVNLLNAYRDNTLPADSVFNMEMMGKFYALCDLSGARHALRWLNCRYFYNAQTNLLEPIGFDSNSGQLKELVYHDNYINEAHHSGIKNSRKFIQHYKKALNRYKKKSFLDQFFSEHKATLDLYIKAIMKTDALDCSKHFNNYYQNQELMTMQ